MAAEAEPKVWRLFYSEKNFRSFEKFLLIELTDDDGENEAFLQDEYDEAELPNDPVMDFLEDLTDNQRNAFLQAAVAADFVVPTRLSVLIDPKKAFKSIDAFIADVSASYTPPNAKYAQFKANRKEHLKKELILYKKLAKTILHAKYLIDEAPFGAGRSLLHAMRVRNEVNATEEDCDELLTQFLNFRWKINEKVDNYKKRLLNLKNNLEKSEADPQPISDKLHKRVYIAGLRVNPMYCVTRR